MGIFIGGQAGISFGSCGGDDGIRSCLIGGGWGGIADGAPVVTFGFAEFGSVTTNCMERSVK